MGGEKFFLRKIKNFWGRDSADGITFFKRVLFLTSPVFGKIFFGKSFFIRSICVMLTHSCNLHCPICGFWGNSGIGNSTEENLTLEDYKNIIEDLSKLKTSLILSGGEPLLNPNWYEIARYAKSKKIHIVLQTNGIYLEKNKEKVIETIDDLSVSIDGPEKIHNRIRGEGTYAKIINNLEEISEIKKRKNLKKPFIDINFTIQELNHKYLIETVQELSKTEIDIRGITIMHLMFFEEKILKEHLDKFSEKFNTGELFKGFLFKVENLDVEELIGQINYLKKNLHKYRFEIIFTPEMSPDKIRKYYDSQYFGKEAGNLQGRCLTPYLEAMITPSGDLFNCMLNIIGNVKEKRLKELWNSEPAKKWRRYLQKNGPLPFCKTCRFRYM